MSYFYALRGPSLPMVAPAEILVDSPLGSPMSDTRALAGPRVGLTVPKVLGKAVDRNRIKRRMRDIVRRRALLVTANVDVILHPRRSALSIEFKKLEDEVVRIFCSVQRAIEKADRMKAVDAMDKLGATPQSATLQSAAPGDAQASS